MKTLLMVAAAVVIFVSCRSEKQARRQILPAVEIETSTDTKIIHVERIDTVIIEIPVQSAERTTPGKESHLETDYAESDAKLNEDGTLTHTLHNKPTKLPVPVKNTVDTVYIDKIIEKPIPVNVPVEVERELTWWQQARLNTWGWIVLFNVLCVVLMIRKPLATIVRHFLPYKKLKTK